MLNKETNGWRPTWSRTCQFVYYLPLVVTLISDPEIKFEDMDSRISLLLFFSFSKYFLSCLHDAYIVQNVCIYSSQASEQWNQSLSGHESFVCDRNKTDWI